ncbi:hypothetical protein MN032_14415 [Agromyces atrinae]|uniref:hypothetical protein n=1 Tax=Agromyces atrinae TaxID=592376 RepID=UPI001F58D949|nr:hypothetical protein [Agromyces atrinae]MCI2958890.1 hypothetical protein [Agromyces atrinae]
MSRLPVILDTDDLPLAELHAARIDGDLIAIGRGFAPFDAHDERSLRARSLAPVALSSGRLIVDRLSAAWVHGACAEPSTVTLCRRVDQRSTALVTSEASVREVILADDDAVVLGGVTVTTAPRTAFDLCLDGGVSDSIAVAALVGLRRNELIDIDDIDDALIAYDRLPHKKRGRRRLGAARTLVAAQPSLTR